jgi:cobalt/nickel transport system permease protein
VTKELLTERRQARSLLHRLDPRAKIVGFIGISRLGAGYILRRMLVVVPFVIVVAIFLPFFDRAGSGGYSLGIGHVDSSGLLVLWNAGAKAVLGVLSMIILASTTTFPDMLAGFQRLRVPKVFVLVVSFMYRYSFVFLEELRRMQRAMESRNYRARWLWNLPTLGRVLGSLFLRSYNRGERVYVAMVSRGYEGTIGLASSAVFGWAEVAFLGALAAAAAAIRVAVSV